MLKHKKYIFKMIVFGILVCLLGTGLNRILNPKYMQDNMWPTTQTYKDFYDMDKNSVDVIFLGSSHTVSAFSPLELYSNYGIRSYNLGCEEQNMLLSYYWLKEALRFQTPKVVILDTYMLFPYRNEPINTPEVTTRKAIDHMKWSAIKCAAIKDICDLDSNQDVMSYYFTNIRFHTRWMGLNEDDFSFNNRQLGLMGYTAINGTVQKGKMKKNHPFSVGENANVEEPMEIMQKYLDDIVTLCKENEIKLILCKTPASLGNVERFNYVNQYAKEHEIRYIDFNEENLYQEIGFDVFIDNNDTDHLNYKGMSKVTNYLGTILLTEYEVEAIEDSQYQDRVLYYQGILKDNGLHEITDFAEYLDAINDPRYVVFLSVKEEGTAALTTELIDKLNKLGATENFEELYQNSYLLIKKKEGIEEEEAGTAITFAGTLRDGKVIYKATSAGAKGEEWSSIVIDGVEYSKNSRGMNIVIYCLDSQKVVDSVCFDTHEGLAAIR